MFTVKTEGMTSGDAAAISAIAIKVAAIAKTAATGKVGNQTRWFGTEANGTTVNNGLKTMSDYLNIKCKTLTFVRKNTGQIVDSALAESSDYGQVIGNIFTTTVGFKKTESHVSSGLRIFAMNEIINAIATNDKEEQLNYVYHEVCHKVLGTVDYRYGKADCKWLATNYPTYATKNADNWGYYIAEIGKNL